MTSRYLIDTDTVTLYLQKQPQVIRQIVQHLSDDLATSIITFEEIVAGWFSALRRSRTPQQVTQLYDRLTETMNELRLWSVLSFSSADLNRYEQLKRLRLNVGKNDLRIAATALESGRVVVTRNLRDFQRVPGLTCEDWSA